MSAAAESGRLGQYRTVAMGQQPTSLITPVDGNNLARAAM